jgi:hypothetical protein
MKAEGASGRYHPTVQHARAPAAGKFSDREFRAARLLVFR